MSENVHFVGSRPSRKVALALAEKRKALARSMCEDRRKGTRATSTVIWPRTSRRLRHVLAELKAKDLPDGVPTTTDFVSAAVDAKLAECCAVHAIVLPDKLKFPVTPESMS